MALNFNDALMEARRRGQLQGRPLTSNEVSGISEGYASSASERLARAKMLGLQEQQLSNQTSQFNQTFAENQRVTNEQLRRADEAMAEAKKQNLISNIGMGSILLYQIPAVKSFINAGASKIFGGLFETGAAANMTPGALAGMEGLTMDMGGLATESLMGGGSTATGLGLGTFATALAPLAIAYGLLNAFDPTTQTSQSPIPAYGLALQQGIIPDQSSDQALQYRHYLETMFQVADPNYQPRDGEFEGAYPGMTLMPEAKPLIDEFMNDPFTYLEKHGGTLENPFINVAPDLWKKYPQPGFDNDSFSGP